MANATRVTARRLCVGVVALAASSVAAAYEIEHVVANGGTTTSTGGTYALSGTIAQPVAGTASAGGVRLEAGFWRAASPLADALFSDGFEGIE